MLPAALNALSLGFCVAGIAKMLLAIIDSFGNFVFVIFVSK
jgi:hypothetical protein